jgi:DNA-binding transcriptional LysR family regulator
MEGRFGEPLFQRAVDGTKLLPFGERLVEPARRMAEWATELERATEQRNTEPAGVVRITALPGLAYDFVAPFAVWAKKKLPAVRLEVISTIRYLDLARRDADLAIRTDRATTRDLVVVAELRTEVGAFASPRYAKTLPARPTVKDIDWIGWAPPFEHLSPNRELAALIPGFSPVFASDDFIVQVRAARAGIGAVVLGRAKHRFSGDSGLVELEIDLGPIPAALYLVSTKSALAIPRVRAVADLLADELKRVEGRPAHPARPAKATKPPRR